MDAGQLRHKIRIERLRTPAAADAHGIAEREWDLVAEVHAAIEPLAGNQYWYAQQVGSSVTHKVTIRYLPEISTLCRVLWGSRQLDVNSVINPGELRIWLELMCTEKTAPAAES